MIYLLEEWKIENVEVVANFMKLYYLKIIYNINFFIQSNKDCIYVYIIFLR